VSGYISPLWLPGGEEKGCSLTRANEIIAGRKRQVVVLDQPVPIYILYRLAYVDPVDSALNFWKMCTAGISFWQRRCSARVVEKVIKFYHA